MIQIFICTPFFDIVDCEWNFWVIGKCTKSCGGGIRERSRTRRVKEANGGRQCYGPSFVKELCNVQPCSGNET